FRSPSRSLRTFLCPSSPRGFPVLTLHFLLLLSHFLCSTRIHLYGIQNIRVLEKSIAQRSTKRNPGALMRAGASPLRKESISRIDSVCLILLVFFCPAGGTLNSLLPAFEKFLTGICIHLRLEYLIDCSVSDSVFCAVPVR